MQKQKTTASNTLDMEYTGVDQWFAIFEKPTSEDTLNYLNADAIDQCQEVREFDSQTALITGPASRMVIHSGEVITGYPFLPGKNFQTLQIRQISEVPKTRCFEGIVTAETVGGSTVKFFAADYPIYCDVYKHESSLEVSLMGLACDVDSFDYELLRKGLADEFAELTQDQEQEFLKNYCALMPVEEHLCCYYLVGKIKEVAPYQFGQLTGFLVQVPVEDLMLSFFVKQENSKLSLEVGAHIQATIWLSGTIKD